MYNFYIYTYISVDRELDKNSSFADKLLSHFILSSKCRTIVLRYELWCSLFY